MSILNPAKGKVFISSAVKLLRDIRNGMGNLLKSAISFLPNHGIYYYCLIESLDQVYIVRGT